MLRYALLWLAILCSLSVWLWQGSSHNSSRSPTKNIKNKVLFLKVRLYLFNIHTESFTDKIICYLRFYWNIVVLSCLCIVYGYFCAIICWLVVADSKSPVSAKLKVFTILFFAESLPIHGLWLWLDLLICLRNKILMFQEMWDLTFAILMLHCHSSFIYINLYMSGNILLFITYLAQWSVQQ